MTNSSHKGDFSEETKYLDQIGNRLTDCELDLKLLPFENGDAYLSFYRSADQEFRRTRVARTPSSALRHYTRIKSFHDLPASSKLHIRGYVDDGRRYVADHARKHDDWMRTGFVPACTFHSQPSLDWPSNEDLFDFLKFSHLRHIVIGPEWISILDKTRKTLELSLDLWKKDEANRHKLKRIKHRHGDKSHQPNQQTRERYAKIVLKEMFKEIGREHWPYRKHEIRRDWVGILKSLGIEVNQVAVIPPTSKSESVLLILSGAETVEDIAICHGVSRHKVERWVERFKKAGSNAIDR